MDIKRLMELAGLDPSKNAEGEYTKPASKKVRKPEQLANNPRFSDNSLAEDLETDEIDNDANASNEEVIKYINDIVNNQNMNLYDAVRSAVDHFGFHTMHQVEKIYSDWLDADKDLTEDYNLKDKIYSEFCREVQRVDHEEAVTRVADKFGVTGEEVEEIIRDMEQTSEGLEDDGSVEQIAEEVNSGLSDLLRAFESDPSDETKAAVEQKLKKYNISDSTFGIISKDLERMLMDVDNPTRFKNYFAKTFSFVEKLADRGVFSDKNAVKETFVENTGLDPETKSQIKNAISQLNLSDYYGIISGDDADDEAYDLALTIHRNFDLDFEFLDHVDEIAELYKEVYNSEKGIDEAYGYRKNSYDQRALERQYSDIIALLPIPGLMETVDELGNNEYFGSDLEQGRSAVVCLAIATSSKPRLTFAITAGSASHYKPGDHVLTFHDQTGAERPADVLLTFSGEEWRDNIDVVKEKMRKAGMDPKKKYSIRVFK